MVAIEEIIIGVRSKTAGLDNLSKQLGEVTRKLSKTTNITQQMTDTNQGFAGVMGMSQQNFKKFNEQGFKFNTTGGRIGGRLRMMTAGLKGFRMEMLGVMFFGLGLKQFFTGMLQPAFQMAGVFELISTILAILFLPVALFLLENVLLPLLDVVANLSPTAQRFVGVIVLLGAAFGMLLFWIGSLALGTGSFIGVFGGMIKAIGVFFTFIGGAGAAVIAFFAIIVLGVIGFFIAWKENWGNIRGWTQVMLQGVKDQFAGIKLMLTGVMDFITSVFTGDWKGAWTAVKQIVEGFLLFMKGIGETILGGLSTAGLSLLRGFKLVFDLVDKFTGGKLTDFVNFGIDIINAIAEGIVKVGFKIKDTIAGFIPDRVKGLFGFGGGQSVATPNFTSVEDFILQPGGNLIKTDPNDTIVGTKGGTGLGSVVNNITINVSAALDQGNIGRAIGVEVERAIERSLRR